KVLAGYGGRIPAPVVLADGAPVREYVVEYAESDYDFLARILADEGITWFFDHGDHSAWTLIDDTRARTKKAAGEPPFLPRTDLITPPPHVFNITVAARLQTSASTTRDFNYENVKAPLDARGVPDKPEPRRAAVDAPYHNERDLEAYVFEVGKYTNQAD